MRWLRKISLRMRSLLRRCAADGELDSELKFHVERQIAENIAAGMAPADARRAALREFGGVEQLKEECRDMRKTNYIHDLAQDLRYGLRMLRKSPGFTAVAVLTLALGIGANAAIFSVMNGVMLRDLPVRHPEELVLFGAHDPGEIDTSSLWLSFPLFREIQRNQTVFSSALACWCDAGMSVETNGSVSLGVVSAVTGDFFSTLDARPELGRLIAPADVDLKTYVPTYVAVLGYEFWRSRYSGAQNVIGQTIRISGVPFTIIGVAQKGFRAISPDIHEGVIIPLTAEPVITSETGFDLKGVREHLERADSLWLNAEGRLKPGITLGRAKAQLESLWPSVRESVRPPKQTLAERATFDALSFAVVSGARGDSFLRNQFAKPLYVLLAISILVLITACANLAGLMLARAESRNHQTAVRAALGATRSRIARQVLTEGLMLSLAGTLAGFVFAEYGSQALAKFIIQQTTFFSESVDLSPDWRILGLAASAAILTGIFSGLASAWRAARQDPAEALQQGTRTLSRGTGRLGRGLVVAQVSLSLVLIGFAGLFLRSLEKLYQVQPGFQADGLLYAPRLDDLPGGYKNLDMVTYYRELIDRVTHLPGTVSVGMAHMGLGTGYEWTETVRREGTSALTLSTDLAMVTPGFFKTVGVHLLRGRTLNWEDVAGSPHVALASASLARQLYPNGDAIGQHIEIPSQPNWRSMEIVGIVGNASLYQIRKASPPTLYVPSMQYGDYMGWSDLYVRAEGPPATVGRAIKNVVASFGHEYILSGGTVSDSINQSLLRERITAMLSAFFGALTLLIAAIGLYGLMSFNVTRRTRELGIRFALGAQRSTVLRVVLRETLTLTLLGIAVGIPCVFVATRLIAHMLFGVTPYDPVTLLGASMLLLAIGAIAGYIPARRAMRVDPMVALRYE